MFSVSPEQAVALRHAMSNRVTNLMHSISKLVSKPKLSADGEKRVADEKAEISTLQGMLVELDLEYPIVPENIPDGTGDES